MAKSSTFANDLLNLIFNGVAIPNLADNAATSPLTNLYWALHSADPGSGGNQTTNELTYTGYVRIAVARTSSGFTITGNVVSPTSVINFVKGTGGSGTATYASVGTSLTGTGKILYSGAISPSIVCGNGITPQIGTGSTLTET